MQQFSELCEAPFRSNLQNNMGPVFFFCKFSFLLCKVWPEYWLYLLYFYSSWSRLSGMYSQTRRRWQTHGKRSGRHFFSTYIFSITDHSTQLTHFSLTCSVTIGGHTCGMVTHRLLKFIVLVFWSIDTYGSELKRLKRLRFWILRKLYNCSKYIWKSLISTLFYAFLWNFV